MWNLQYDDSHIDVIWVGDDHPKCRFCDEPLMGYMLKKMHLHDIPGYDGHALDIECICKDCRAIFVFGIAISEEDFNKIKCLEIVA